MDEATKFETYAIVELFGHQVIASQGYVRVDVPAAGEVAAFTRFFGTGAIYSITPTTEDIVRAFVVRNVRPPIQPYQIGLPERTLTDRDGDYEAD